jgi:hypothetical protein
LPNINNGKLAGQELPVLPHHHPLGRKKLLYFRHNICTTINRGVYILENTPLPHISRCHLGDKYDKGEAKDGENVTGNGRQGQKKRGEMKFKRYVLRKVNAKADKHKGKKACEE